MLVFLLLSYVFACLSASLSVCLVAAKSTFSRVDWRLGLPWTVCEPLLLHRNLP